MSKMANHSFREKLKKGKTVLGSWVTLGHPLIPEILSHAGFDWLAVDLEHSSIDLTQLLPLLISIEANHMVPFVRVGELNSNLIKRVLDAGARGVIVANVRSQEEAARAVKAVKYPPAGERGVGLYRAQGFGEKFEDYVRRNPKESMVVVQIEHVDALSEIDRIFSTTGIDAYVLGPYDLSASMGRPGDFTFPEFRRAEKLIMASAKQHGVAPGIHSVSSDSGLALKRLRSGYRFVAYGTDFMFMKDMAKKGVRILRSAARLSSRSTP